MVMMPKSSVPMIVSGPMTYRRVRRCERGHKTADTALQDREDQDIKPDDDQPNDSNPPHLRGL